MSTDKLVQLTFFTLANDARLQPSTYARRRYYSACVSIDAIDAAFITITVFPDFQTFLEVKADINRVNLTSYILQVLQRWAFFSVKGHVE